MKLEQILTNKNNESNLENTSSIEFSKKNKEINNFPSFIKKIFNDHKIKIKDNKIIDSMKLSIIFTTSLLFNIAYAKIDKNIKKIDLVNNSIIALGWWDQPYGTLQNSHNNVPSANALAEGFRKPAYPGGDNYDFDYVGGWNVYGFVDLNYAPPLQEEETLYVKIKQVHNGIEYKTHLRWSASVDGTWWFPDLFLDNPNNPKIAFAPNILKLDTLYPPHMPDSAKLWLKNYPNNKLDGIIDIEGDYQTSDIIWNLECFPQQVNYNHGDTFYFELKKIIHKDYPKHDTILLTKGKSVIDTFRGMGMFIKNNGNFNFPFPDSIKIRDIYQPYLYELTGPINDTIHQPKYNIKYKVIDYSPIEYKLISIYNKSNHQPETLIINPDSVIGNNYNKKAYFSLILPDSLFNSDTVYCKYYGKVKDNFNNIGYSDTNQFYIPPTFVEENNNYKIINLTKQKSKKIINIGGIKINYNKNFEYKLKIFDITGRKLRDINKRNKIYIIRKEKK